MLDTSSRISTILRCGDSNIPVQLMSQLLSSPCHQKSWYWLGKSNGYLWSKKKDLNFPTYILASPQKGPFTEYISFPFHFMCTTVNSLTCLRYKCYPCCMPQASRQHSGYGLSQWETTLQCNVVSHWLSPLSLCKNRKLAESSKLNILHCMRTVSRIFTDNAN